jgi:hypothetical protein
MRAGDGVGMHLSLLVPVSLSLLYLVDSRTSRPAAWWREPRYGSGYRLTGR